MFSEAQHTDTEILIYTYNLDQEPAQEEEETPSYPKHVYEENGLYYCAPTTQNEVYCYAYCLNNPLIYTDPSGEIIFTTLAAIFVPPLLPIAILADVGMYTGGSIQQGTANPFQWDYSDRDLYKAMAVGGIVGGGIGAGGMYLANLAWGVGSTAMSLPSWGTISAKYPTNILLLKE